MKCLFVRNGKYTRKVPLDESHLGVLTRLSNYEFSTKCVNKEGSTEHHSYICQVKRIFSLLCQDLSQCWLDKIKGPIIWRFSTRAEISTR